jgi:hypothetical protein
VRSLLSVFFPQYFAFEPQRRQDFCDDMLRSLDDSAESNKAALEAAERSLDETRAVLTMYASNQDSPVRMVAITALAATSPYTALHGAGLVSNPQL